MAGCDLVKLLLDTLFEKRDLKSYTINDNSGLTVCTLRFGDGCTDSEHSKPERNTYVKKSNYHMKRDKVRHEQHIRPKTRSITRDAGIELNRSDDCVFSETGLSHDSDEEVTNPISPEVNNPCLTDSPTCTSLGEDVNTAVMHNDSPSAVMESRVVDSPSSSVQIPEMDANYPLHVSEDMLCTDDLCDYAPDSEEKLLELCPGLMPSSRRRINKGLFIEHLRSRGPLFSYKDIICSNTWKSRRGTQTKCNVSFDCCDIQLYGEKLTFCGNCKLYYCSSCDRIHGRSGLVTCKLCNHPLKVMT